MMEQKILIDEKRNKAGCWPTYEQELLLKAALLKGNSAIDAWREWKSKVYMDEIDSASFRMLPLLYHSLCNHGIDDPLVAKLKGIYRQNWCRNQILFQKLAYLLFSFQRAGIKTMILKGPALVLLNYKDLGLRLMSDFDILIPARDVFGAIDLVQELGYEPAPMPPQGFNENYFSLRHAQRFKNSEGFALDLHWHIFLEACWQDADNDFWESSISVKVNDIQTQALNPTDQLLHSCVHGLQWDDAPPLRWVADAVMIMNTSQIDWQRLITQGKRCGLTLALKKALGYLRYEFAVSVPQEILQGLDKISVSTSQQFSYRIRTHRPGFLLLYFRYLKAEGDTGLHSKIAAVKKVFKHVWGVDHLWQVPFYVIARGMRKVFKISLDKLRPQ